MPMSTLPSSISPAPKKHTSSPGLYSDLSDNNSLWSRSDSASITATDEAPSHEASKLEASTTRELVPRVGGQGLSKGILPTSLLNPRGQTRIFKWRLAHVSKDHESGKNGVWERVGDWVVDFLKRKEPVEDGERYWTNPTIWVGVLPKTLTGDDAFDLIQEIRAFLNELQVKDVDIAFRESIVGSLVGNGPALYAPVESGDPLQDVIDNASVTLSLPISGRATMMQGTLCPFFQHEGKLYAITARHNVVLANDDNASYKYKPSAPKRKVIVMGNPTFTTYLTSILARIGNLNDTVKFLKEGLEEHEAELTKTERKIISLKKFYVTMSKKWSKLGDRAPVIGVGVGPNRFTRDFCIIELDKSKFMHLGGNVLSLGPKYSEADLKALMYERIDVPSEFKYPEDCLLMLRGTLTAEQVNNPNSSDSQGDRIRRVLKRGVTTNTTVGTLTHFMSFVRKYFTTGILESLELPILPHESETGTFSKGGDSGALIASVIGEFVGLLTGGTNKDTDGSDITFATLFEYIWELILKAFPDASLYWDDIPAFLAATVQV
ncbi:hypothetical protein K488DRAFT_71757 [Vararia minispora EC-137]|uniref:Uncharacterized protein n=1 Tax=Vararia minispora EC-137 TaxID=1314806 RepID=A0ACB8QH95_9AGAM|nr:hypothetical protein K488DRAFT_71757 [Vararia minispora EC-137]